MAKEYHPDIQDALKAGRITPNQAKWMNNYQNTAGNPEIGTAGIRDGISEKMMNYRNAVRAGEHTRPSWMEPIPKEVKMPKWFDGKLDLDREGLRQLDKIPNLIKKAFNASEYSNTFPAGVNDANYYNELLKASKDNPDYQPYIDELNKLRERNQDIGKQDGGTIHMQVGGLSKLAKILKKDAPNIIIPSDISRVKEAVRQSKGDFGARRVERAADEIPNLEKLYKEEALKQAFTGDNAKALMTMNPKDFERYATPIPKSAEMPMQYRVNDLMKVKDGFADVPFFLINKEEQGLPLIPLLDPNEAAGMPFMYSTFKFVTVIFSALILLILL